MLNYKVKFLKPYLDYKKGDVANLDEYKAAQLKEKGFVEGEDIPTAAEAQKKMFRGEKVQKQITKQFKNIKSKKNGSNN